MHRAFSLILLLILATGCSIKKMAINRLADSLAGSSDVYASDEDPELVREALPFALKTMESLLAEAPRHYGLLVNASAGFTQYAYAFVWLDAEEIESTDPEKAKALRERARLLYLRAKGYGLRALEVRHENFSVSLERDAPAAVSTTTVRDVPALFWTSVSWMAAVSQAKGDMDLVADLPAADTMIRKALQLDPSFDSGAIHEFLISYEAGRAGGSVAKAREHYEAAMQVNEVKKMGPLVSLAENVSVQEQNRKEFLDLLDRVLNFDVNTAPKYRLGNLLAQKRARQLKSRLEDLFLDEVQEQQENR